MDEIKFSLYNEVFKEKPNSNELKKINNEIYKHKYADDFEKFAEYVSTNLCAFAPAIFNGNGRNVESVEEIQILCLDFDNSKDGEYISFDEVLERSEKLDLPIAFAYETVSSKNCSRFRVIFRYFEPITNKEFYKVLYTILLEFFPEADKATKDICRIFYGGKGLITKISHKMLYPQRLFSSLYKYFDSNPKKTVENINRFSDRLGIDVIKGNFRTGIYEKSEIEQIKDKILYNNLNSNEVFVIFLKSFEKSYNKASVYKPIKGIAKGDICNGCMLINHFIKGERWLYYNEIWGILTNLVHISGGIKYFTQIIRKLPEIVDYPYDYEKWESNIKQIKKCHYSPSRCENFCSYHNKCKHSKNIITTIKPNRYGITVKDYKKEYISIEQAREDLQYVIKSAIDSNDEDIHIINAQTGIGKTEAYINIIGESSKNFIIAVPTNSLKNEIYNRLCNAEVDAIVTPELPNDIEDREKEKLENLYRKGNLFGYCKFLNKLEQKYESIKSFKKNLKKAKKYRGNIVTTHARLLYLFDENTLNSHSIIIDEDILDTIFNIGRISHSEINYILGRNYLRKAVKDRIKYYSKINNNTCGQYKKHIREMPLYLSEKEIESISDDENISIDVEKFLNANATMADKNYVHYAWIKYLPAQKIILLSATVNKEVYERFFENKNHKIKYYEIREVKYKGNVIQNCNKSYSRIWMSNNEEEIEKIRSNHENCSEITFKAYKDSNSDIYFGVTDGKNGLGGKDMLILGTPFFNELVYKLMAACLDYDVKIINNSELNHRLIEYDEYSFYFFTYADEFLKNLQIYFISSELEQSVGRARLLNNDCTVYVYSAFPVKQARFVEEALDQCNSTEGTEV